MGDMSISAVREKYPQYKDMSDQALADALYGKFYSDMPKDQFYGKIGLGAAPKPDATPSTDPAVAPEDTTGFAKDVLAEAMAIPSPPDVPATRNAVPSGVSLGLAQDAAVPRIQKPKTPDLSLLTADGSPTIERSTNPGYRVQDYPPSRAPAPDLSSMDMAIDNASKNADPLADAMTPPVLPKPPAMAPNRALVGQPPVPANSASTPLQPPVAGEPATLPPPLPPVDKAKPLDVTTSPFAGTPDRSRITGIVSKIIDGDTIVVGGHKIRVAGLDCPEKKGGSESIERWKKSTALMTELADGTIATIETNGETNNDRLVGYVTVDGKDIGQQMIDAEVCGVWEKFDSAGKYVATYQGAPMREDNGKGVIPTRFLAGRTMETASDPVKQRGQMLTDIEEQLKDPSLPPETRAFLEQNLADLSEGQQRLRPDAPDVGPSFPGKAAGHQNAGTAPLAPIPQDDKSTVMGDLKAGYLGLRNAGTSAAILADQGRANLNRGYGKEAAARVARIDTDILDYQARIAASTNDAEKIMLEEGLNGLMTERQGYLDIAADPAYQAQGEAMAAKGDAFQDRIIKDRIPTLMARSAEADAIPSNPASVEIGKAETFKGGLKALASDPIGAVRSLVLRSAPQMAPTILATIAGQAVAGPGGAAVAGGATGAAIETFSHSSQEMNAALSKAGVDVSDPEAVEAFLTEHADEIQEMYTDGLKRGGIIGAFDAVSGGIAGKIAVRVAEKGLKAKIGGIAAGTTIEAATEGAGEAAAGYAVTGKVSPGEVIAEIVGGTGMGIPTAVGQVAVEVGKAKGGTSKGKPSAPSGNGPKQPKQPDPLADAMTPPKAPQNITENIPAAAGDPLTDAMAPDAPPSVQPRTDQNPVKKPDEDGWEIMDEVETVDGETRPTGRRVRINTATGDAEVVDEGSDAVKGEGIGGVGPTGDNPQAAREAEVVSTPSPPAEPETTPAAELRKYADTQEAPPANVGTTRGPTRKFLSHDETLAIETDPKTFQYKGGADTEGVTEALRGVKAFDPNRAGQVVLFETKDGRTIVADGHQRTGLARRMAEQGQEDVGGMAAVIYREADGYTATEVTELAALKNISEGSGTAVDAARVLRNRKDSIADLGLPPNSALVRKAEGLRRLSPDAFGMVVNGVASEELGDVVGRNVTDEGLQPQVLAYLSKNTPANLAQAAMIARDMASDFTTETQDSLFGAEQIQQSLYVERAKVLDGALKSLGTNIRTFRTLIDKAETISTKGNTLDAKQNATQVDDDTKVRQYLTSQANMKGPISDALTKAAEILRSGGSVARAVQGFIGDTRGALQGTGTGSQAPAPGRSSDEVSAKVEPEAVEPELDAPGDDLFAAMLPPPKAKPDAKPAAPRDDLLSALAPVPQGKSPDQVKKETEAKVKAKQSKIGTTVPQADAGALFNTQSDIEETIAAKTPDEPISKEQAPPADPDGQDDAAFSTVSDEDLADLYEIELPMARAAIAKMLPKMRAELDRLDLSRVKLALDETGADWQGMVIGNPFTDMSIIIGASVDPMRTVYHEVIHILRAMNLFTAQEWTALEIMAEREWIAKYDIEERYPDLTREEQIEEAIAEAFADAVATKTPPKGGMIITAFNKIARALRGFRNVLNGAGFQTAEDVFGKVYAAELTKRGAATRATDVAKYQRAPLTEDDRFAAQIMQELAQVDDLFQHKRSTATTLDAAFAEIDTTIVSNGRLAEDDPRTEGKGAEIVTMFSTAKGDPIYIYETDGEIWIDVSNLTSGQGGNAIYAAVSEYALNTGKVFIGDPEGLSLKALRRRTDNMLSSALKHGTTRHIAPHQDQIDGNPKQGVPGLEWTEGDHLANIVALIEVSTANLIHLVPEVANARYDFKTGTFRTGEGKPISDEVVDEWKDFSERNGTPSVGASTLKRGILLNTLAHAESGERSGILERSLRQPRNLVAAGLSRTFYQRAKATSFSGPAIDRIKAANAEFAPPQRPEQLPLPPLFTVPNRDKVMVSREVGQDRFAMFEAVNAAIEIESKSKIPEGANFYLRQTVYDGRTSARIEKVLTDEVKPITEAMKRAKIDADDLGTYLLAAHAKERNAVMAQRDPARFGNGNGSGLYDSAADALLAQFAAEGKITKLKYLAKMVSDMLARDMDLRESAGLMSKAEADGFRKMYKNYTPLRGFAERDEGGQTGRLGKGFDIRGKEVRTALGRMSIADNPLVQAIAMRQEGIVRAEKQRANKSLFLQVQKYPNKDLWEIMGKLPTRKILDPDTGMTKNIVDFGAVNEDEVVALKISGQAYYIRIKDPLMAEAVKNMHIAKQSSIELLAKTITIVGKMTRMISRLATGANPNFVFPNAMSDFSEGVWTAYNADKKRMALSYAVNYPLALATAIQGEIRDSSTGRTLSRLPSKLVKRLTGSDIPPEEMGRLERYREEWEQAGGKISFMAFRDLDEITADINAAIKGDGYKRWVTKPWTIPIDMMQVVEKLNQPIESAGRLAMYMTARQNGYSQDRAAAMALDASGNYYRKGRATRGMAAFYAFFNPAVQGVEKFARFAKRPRNIAVLGGVVATGYAMTLMNMLMWEDDDDPERRPLYLQIPEFERRRSLIIPYGVEIDQSVAEGQPGRQRLKYFMFRVPHNLRFLLTMGNEAAIMQMGYGTAKDAASNVTSSLLTSMNPFGSDTVANAAAPTVIDPFVDLALNRSWTGTPIRPDEAMWNEGVPQASQFFERSNSAAAVWTAEKLNQIGGGDRFTPSPALGGLLDRYPGELDYLFNYWTGGLGRFVNMTGEAVLDKAQGVETDPGAVPILRSVVGRTNSFPAQERYYSWRDKMNADRNQLRAVRKAALESPEDAEAATEWEHRSKQMNVGTKTIKHKDGTTSEKLVWTDSVVGPIDDADDQLKALREKLTDIQNNISLSRKDRVIQQRRVKLEIEDVQRIAIRAYLAKRTFFEAAAGSE